MTYAILTPVYGIPLRNNSGKSIGLSEKLRELLYGDNEEKGFLCFYSDDQPPVAFGVIIGKDLDECDNHIELSSLVMVAPEKKVKKFNQLYKSIDKDLQEEMKQFGEARVFYLWSTS